MVVTFEEFVDLAEEIVHSNKQQGGFSFIDYDDPEDDSPYHYRFGIMNWFDSHMALIGGYGGYTIAIDIMDIEEGYEDLKKRIREFFVGYLFWTEDNFENSKIKVEFD